MYIGTPRKLQKRNIYSFFTALQIFLTKKSSKTPSLRENVFFRFLYEKGGEKRRKGRGRLSKDLEKKKETV